MKIQHLPGKQRNQNLDVHPKHIMNTIETTANHCLEMEIHHESSIYT